MASIAKIHKSNQLNGNTHGNNLLLYQHNGTMGTIHGYIYTSFFPFYIKSKRAPDQLDRKLLSVLHIMKHQIGNYKKKKKKKSVFGFL